MHYHYFAYLPPSCLNPYIFVLFSILLLPNLLLMLMNLLRTTKCAFWFWDGKWKANLEWNDGWKITLLLDGKKKSKRKWSGNSIRFYFSYPKLARLYDDIASLSWHFCPWDFLKCVGSKLLDFHTWCSIQNFKIKLPPSKYLRI